MPNDMVTAGNTAPLVEFPLSVLPVLWMGATVFAWFTSSSMDCGVWSQVIAFGGPYRFTVFRAHLIFLKKSCNLKVVFSHFDRDSYIYIIYILYIIYICTRPCHPPSPPWDGSPSPLWCGGGVALSPSPPCGVVGVWYGMLGMYGVYGRSGMACLESMVRLVCTVGMVCMAWKVILYGW